MKITYIKHSCFLIEFSNAYFLFDYFDGVLPSLDEKKHIYIFASHVHHDHFSWKIFSLFPRRAVTYLLSMDIRKKYSPKYFLKKDVSKKVFQEIVFVQERKTYEIEDLIVETLRSTDAGVAFIVQYQNKCLYHAGDLNLWTWDEESAAYNAKMEMDYMEEIERIKEYHFDVAFVVLDPRQEENFYKGFDYFMRTTKTDIVYPMHMWEDHRVIDALMDLDLSSPYRNKIQKI